MWFFYSEGQEIETQRHARIPSVPLNKIILKPQYFKVSLALQALGLLTKVF